jgi:hypothetical protein
VKRKDIKVLKMSDDLFKHRRRVMGFLYEARKAAGIELPRVMVRIVEFPEHPSVAGVSIVNKNEIHIALASLSMTDDQLRLVVWHELAHAYFDAKHNENCLLMHPIGGGRTYTKEQLAPIFKRLANKS